MITLVGLTAGIMMIIVHQTRKKVGSVPFAILIFALHVACFAGGSLCMKKSMEKKEVSAQRVLEEPKE